MSVENVVKVDDKLGVVFGWAIVCAVDGEDYYDTQGDHIPEDAMLKAATDFMVRSRAAKEMHTGPVKGMVCFAFPMTTDLSAALGITTSKTGLMVGIKPDDPAVLGKFLSGEYVGFSMGGVRIVDDEVQ